ncbi:MAG: hypothetical protein ACR2GH_18815, partial [Pseudonocardia sp.]
MSTCTDRHPGTDDRTRHGSPGPELLICGWNRCGHGVEPLLITAVEPLRASYRAHSPAPGPH